MLTKGIETHTTRGKARGKEQEDEHKARPKVGPELTVRVMAGRPPPNLIMEAMLPEDLPVLVRRNSDIQGRLRR